MAEACGQVTGSGQNYTSSQRALYRYWNEWVELSGIKSKYADSNNYSAR